MAILDSKGLRGLPGLNNLSEQERQAFMDANASVLNTYRSPRARMRAAEAMYNNQQFINRFGQEAFDSMRGRAEDRDALLKETIVNDAYKEAYSPFEDKQDSKGKRDNSKGLGKDFEKYYYDLSTDAKLKLLQSDWKTPEQMKQQQGDYTGVGFLDKAIGFVAGEAIDQHRKESNDRILQNIYNDDADAKSKDPEIASAIGQVYMNQDVTGHNNEETKKLFYEAITPSKTNYGISEYASHYGDGSEDQVTSEMEEFSIDDMRQVLAKKYIYDRTMSPEMASTALNNEARRYIKAHQGSAKRFLLFANDVGISALSYTADKINGIYNLGLAAADKLSDWGMNSEKPIVLVDDQSNVIDPNMQGLSKDSNGIFYIDEEGKRHSVHQEQIDRTTLHNMGKNLDGSEDTSLLNAQYWTRAEQFGTLDEDEQKQYEKLGSSPYKVAYNPNEDSDLWYESFKMMSFGIADAASMLIPFGVGVAGRALSTASKAGKVSRGLGKAMDTAGKYLSAQTRAGQVIQGSAGAAGIAYAYNRGTFQETLAQNLANAEEANFNRSKQEIYDRYHNNEAYKAEVDAAIADRAAKMKAEYIAQNSREGGQVIESPEFNEMIRAKAQDQVLGELVQSNAEARKGTEEYAALQQEAINSAGDAAVRTFLPEAIKYGLVNTIGFRKFLYTNPAGLKKSVSAAFKGMEEKAASDGAMRMTAGASKFGTIGDKAKQFGKIAASQVWGGAWTNGTDDMMVDAAERINEDDFRRYTDAYQKGEAVADTYGIIDGLYSYWKGLQNSLGQGTTWNAAAIGGLGSLVSASPNMANIAHLASKEGRDAYRNNFMKRPVYETGEDGIRRIKRDEQGNPVMEDVSLSENWRERANFFIQNGVLNNYYGKKQSERELQNHADYVNDILDKYDDFRAITDMVNSDISRDNADNIKDKKTANFVHAIELMNVLDHLGKDRNDPTTMSSVVQGMQDFIAKADAYNQGNQEAFTQDEISQMLKEYSAVNPQFDIEAEGNAEIAFGQIMQNAKKLKEANDAYNKAEEEVQKVEKTLGYRISPAVREELKLNKALQGHWQERIDAMRDEIKDTSDINSETEGAALLSTYGGKKKVEKEIAASEKADEIYNRVLNENIAKTQKALDKYNAAQEVLKAATTSDETYRAQENVTEAKAEYEDALASKQIIDDNISANKEKKARLQKALKEQDGDWKVLKADEIMSLNPIDRARMMNPANRNQYNPQQVKQIEKLESELGVDGVQKVQDIASLSRRIAQNKDAYRRISNNPEAAAVEFERQEAEAAKKAHGIITKRNARTLAEVVKEAEEGLKNRKGVTQDDIDRTVYRMLRRHNSNMLDSIEEDKLLPQYSKQLNDAKEWAKITDDISAVIDNASEDAAWKDAISQSIDNVIEPADTREGIMTNMEKAVEANPEMEKVLDGLNKLGYHRDATVIESRNQRKVREEAQKKKEEEELSQKDAEVKKAQEKAAAKAKISKNDAVNLDDEGSRKNLDQAQEVPIDYEVEGEEKAEETQQKEEPSVNNITMGHDEVLGDFVKSPTLEQQVSEAGELSDVQEGVDFIDAEEESDKQTQVNVDDNSSDSTLGANAMGEWIVIATKDDKGNWKYGGEGRSLSKDHILIHKKSTPGDSMDQFYKWLDTLPGDDVNGVKYQDIIDDELPQILAKNPKMKIKFMKTNHEIFGKQYPNLLNHLFLVVDYDDFINPDITSIHNKDNGGIIKTTSEDGKEKQYLIVGTVGYGKYDKDSARFQLWKNLMDSYKGQRLKEKAAEWFKGNKTESFYVPAGLTSEVIPGSMIPGYIVRGNLRKITDLLKDTEANPHNLDLGDLGWGIQRISGYKAVNTKGKEVMIPQNNLANSGRAFVLIPAGNGKLLSAYVRNLKWGDAAEGDSVGLNKNSQLYQDILDATRRIVSKNYDTRLEAVSDLSRIFYFDDTVDSDNILIGTKDKPMVSFKHGDITYGPYSLENEGEAYEQMLKAYDSANPTINITLEKLANVEEIRKLDEAGALMTDLAKLGTAGISYSIYGLTANGEMMRPAPSKNVIHRRETDSSYSNPNAAIVRYAHGIEYLYNRNTGEFRDTTTGTTVPKDTELEEMLRYTFTIEDQGLESIRTEKDKKGDVWNYYIIDAGSKEVVKQNERNVIEKLSDAESEKLIKEVEEKKALEAKEAEMKRLLEEQQEATPTIDEETGSLTFVEEKEKKKGGEDNMTLQSDTSIPPISTEYRPQSETQSLGQLLRKGGEQKKTLMDLLQSDEIKVKWPEITSKLSKPSELISFLKEKGIPHIDNIGTSKADFDAWLHFIECAS